MVDETENNQKNDSGTEDKHLGIKDRISGIGQVIIGELETIGGVLTGDPTTEAEGGFNVEVGTIRDEIEEDLDEGDR